MGVEVIVEVEVPEEAEEAAKPTKGPTLPSIQVQSTLTSHLASGRGVPCISDGGVLLFSVLSPPLAPGRTCSSPSPTTSEGPASLENHLK